MSDSTAQNSPSHEPPHVAVAEPQVPETTRAWRETKHPMVFFISLLIPGAGHMVKGRQTIGIVLLVGALLVLGWSVLLAPGTYGVGLLLIPVYWIAVAMHAFSIRAPDEMNTKR